MPRKPPMPKPKKSTVSRTGRSADAAAGAAAASKSKPRGTADSLARRSGKQFGGADTRGIPSKNKGTHTGRDGKEYANYRTVESSTKKINNGKRISENKKMSGMAEEGDSSGETWWSHYGERIKSSDAIVKPRVVKKAAPRGAQARAKKK
jgi:hypothetical protein